MEEEGYEGRMNGWLGGVTVSRSFLLFVIALPYSSYSCSLPFSTKICTELPVIWWDQVTSRAPATKFCTTHSIPCPITKPRLYDDKKILKILSSLGLVARFLDLGEGVGVVVYHVGRKSRGRQKLGKKQPESWR